MSEGRIVRNGSAGANGSAHDCAFTTAGISSRLAYGFSNGRTTSRLSRSTSRIAAITMGASACREAKCATTTGCPPTTSWRNCTLLSPPEGARASKCRFRRGASSSIRRLTSGATSATSPRRIVFGGKRPSYTNTTGIHAGQPGGAGRSAGTVVAYRTPAFRKVSRTCRTTSALIWAASSPASGRSSAIRFSGTAWVWRMASTSPTLASSTASTTAPKPAWFQTRIDFRSEPSMPPSASR